MILKYDIDIQNEVIFNRLKNLINQVYKLLPTREEGKDWEKPLETVIQELAGMHRLMNCNYSEVFFPLFNKLEGLYSLTHQKNFLCFRRTIFECLGLISELQKKICHQNY